jgi:hypothetical protein
MRKMQPRYRSVGARKDRRRSIRNVLGTGRDDAPRAEAAITAAQHLDALMRDASDGALRVSITDATGNPRSWAWARGQAREER